MFSKIISKLKFKKKQLEVTSEDCNNVDSLLEENVDIIISNDDNIYKVEISDYVTIGYYVKKMRSSNEYKILDSICNCVLWCTDKQKVNKGIYYVILMDNRIYNILFTDEKIRIDERLLLKLDEESLKENITHERVITYNLIKKEYHYYAAKHESNGNTYYTKYYDKNRNYSFGTLDLTKEETYSEASSLISNLENIEGIDDIIDIKFFKDNVLKDLNEDIISLKKTL